MLPFSESQPSTPGLIKAYSGYELIIVTIILIVIDVICVGLRLAARYLSKAHAGADDYLAIPSLIFCVAFSAVSIGKSKGFNLSKYS